MKVIISIIIACFNSEQFIEETLTSLLNQKKFQDYEIICIDDGSQDKTLSLLRKYEEQYSNKIKVFSQENQGASAARNFGLTKISNNSEIVTFVDSDDVVSRNFLFLANQFFNQYSNINLAVCPIQYFGKVSKPHGLNWRFKKYQSCVNIIEHPECIHFNLGGTFFRTTLFLEQKIQFNTNLNFWEDALLINQIILQEKDYGLINKSKYYYRKLANNSLVDISWESKERYSILFSSGYQGIFDYSCKLYNQIIPYAQILIVYHLKLFFLPDGRKNLANVTNKKLQQNFIQNVVKILLQVENDNILNQWNSPEINNLLLEIKEQKKLPKIIQCTNRLNEVFILRKSKFKFKIMGKIVANDIPKDIVKIYYYLFPTKIVSKQEVVIEKIVIFDLEIENYYSFECDLGILNMLILKKIVFLNDSMRIVKKYNLITTLIIELRKRFYREK